MKRTAQLASFRAAPVGLAHVGAHWVHFCEHAKLFGVLLWGRPGGDDIAALVRSLELELTPDIAPHQSLVDASRLTGADAAAFEVLGAYVVAQQADLARQVTRLALVRPEGMAGAVIAGFFSVTASPYPVQIFDDAPAALAWLGEDPALATELDRIVSEGTGVSELVARLRAALAEHLRTADLALAARALGVSERTLQRRLRAEDTSFAAELLAARLAEAQRQMRDTTEPLSTIAFTTGFSSQQHFSRAFKAAFGTTPSAWRAGA